MATISLETEAGKLRVHVLSIEGAPIMVAEGGPATDAPIVRFHSACVFSEAFHATDCDCGHQLTAALQAISKEGGFVTYAWEEGRGVGILEKAAAITLQQTAKLDTAKAFRSLGHDPDPRDFQVHVAALKTVYKGKRLRFATHNPKKLRAIKAAGFEVVEVVKLEVPQTPEIMSYRREKARTLKHDHEPGSSSKR
jgi:GTP cyclohydrolase II